MPFVYLLGETLEADSDERGENQSSQMSLRVFGIGLHSIELSVGEVTAIFNLLGGNQSSLSEHYPSQSGLEFSSN